jgi:hypothetical protein
MVVLRSAASYGEIIPVFCGSAKSPNTNVAAIPGLSPILVADDRRPPELHGPGLKGIVDAASIHILVNHN